MGRGGWTGMKQRSTHPLRKKVMYCEDSDEDYVAEVDEVDEKSDDLDSLVRDTSGGETCNEGEEEEDCDAFVGKEDGWRTVAKPKPKSEIQEGFSRSRKSRVNRPKKRRKVTRDHDGDSEDDGDDDDDDDDEFTLDDFEYLMEEEADYDEEDDREGEWRIVVKPKSKSRVPKRYSSSRQSGVARPKKGTKVTCNNDNDSVDEEYIPENLTEAEEEDDNEEEDGSESEWKTMVKPKPKPKLRVQEGFSRPRKNGVNKPKKRRKVTRDSVGDSDDDSDDEYTPDELEYLTEEEEDEYGEKVNYDEEDGSVGECNTVLKLKPKPKSKSKVRNGFSRSRKNGVNKPKTRRKGKHDDDKYDDEDEEFTPSKCEYLEEDEVEDDNEEETDDDDDDEEEDEDEEESPKAKISKRGRIALRKNQSWKIQRKRTAMTARKHSKTGSERTNSPTKKAKSVVVEECIEKGPTLRDRSKRNPGQRKNRVTAVSDSDIRSDSSDYEFTISEEESQLFKESSLFCRTMATHLRNSRRHQEDETVCEPNKPSGRKGKEKAGETKSEMGKSVCGICLTEEGKNTVRGTLDCCSHYFCFACIMEWSKVETRCPLCKQRFVTISKPTKCGKGFDLRNSVVTVPERDQVYQPSEEELQDLLNPYENVICTECHQGGDDAVMLLCDICDSPAHTYCVGLGLEVPEGNWYCDGCRPAALASLSQTQETLPDQRAGASASNGRSTYQNMTEIDLNVTIPETRVISQGDGSLSSPISGPGVSTVSGRRRIHRQLHYFLTNRMSQNGLAANTAFNHDRLDVGTSHHPQRIDRFHDFHSVQNHRNQSGPRQPCTSRSSVEPDTGIFSSENWDEERVNIAKQEIRSTVRNQLQNMSRDMNLGHYTEVEISRRSEHIVMVACGLEPQSHFTNRVNPPNCNHLRDRLTNATSGLLNGCCSVCFQDFVKVVVKRIMDQMTAPYWQDSIR